MKLVCLQEITTMRTVITSVWLCLLKFYYKTSATLWMSSLTYVVHLLTYLLNLDYISHKSMIGLKEMYRWL